MSILKKVEYYISNVKKSLNLIKTIKIMILFSHQEDLMCAGPGKVTSVALVGRSGGIQDSALLLNVLPAEVLVWKIIWHVNQLLKYRRITKWHVFFNINFHWEKKDNVIESFVSIFLITWINNTVLLIYCHNFDRKLQSLSFYFWIF